MHDSDVKAVCRGCGRELIGKPYSQGGSAYIPRSMKSAKVCHYGGYVCSRECDYRACLEQERSMPGHDHTQSTVGVYARLAIENNWRD